MRTAAIVLAWFIWSVAPMLAQTSQLAAIARKRANAGGADPLASIKTGMVSFYDFADATDAHSDNDWTEVGTPDYTGGRVLIVASTNTLTTPGSAGELGAEFLPASGGDADASFACWVASNSSTGNGEDIFGGKAGRILLEHKATSNGWAGRIGTLSAETSSVSGVPVDDQYYFVVMTHDAATDTNLIRVDDSIEATSVITPSSTDNTMAVTGDCSIRWLAFWNRKLTSAEITALYSEGSTMVYADLP